MWGARGRVSSARRILVALEAGSAARLTHSWAKRSKERLGLFLFCFLISGFSPFPGALGHGASGGLERGHAWAGRGCETAPAAPRRRISLCPHLHMHLSSQTLDKHCVIHLPRLSVHSAWGGGGQWGRGRAAEERAFHAFLPPDSSWYHGGRRASAPCPKIPTDSSVGEGSRHEGTGGAFRGSVPSGSPRRRSEGRDLGHFCSRGRQVSLEV